MMTTAWARLRAGVMALAPLLAASVAQAACELKTFELPVRMAGGSPVATMTLNGVEVTMLVDSGAFYSMLLRSTAEQLKLPKLSMPDGMRVIGYTGGIETYRTRVEKVGFLGGTMSKLEFIVGGNELGHGIQGILGRNILAAGDTEYDLAHGMVRLHFPSRDCDKADMAYWAPNDAPVVVVPLETDGHRDSHAARVRVRVNGTGIAALMDTGVLRTHMTLGGAERTGLRREQLTETGRVSGLGQTTVTMWRAKFSSFELGGERVGNVEFGVSDTDALDDELLIGMDYFLSHRIFVSRTQRKVYLTWNGGPVFAQGTDRVGRYDQRLAVVPAALADGDADGLARRGAAALAAGDLTRAMEDLDRAIVLSPGVAGHHVTRAAIHAAQGDVTGERADLDEALRLDPALAQARIRRVLGRGVAGDLTGAAEDLAYLDSTLAPSAPARLRMGEAWEALDRPQEALRQWTLWVDTHPKDAQLGSTLHARCRLRAKLDEDLALALADCRRAVDLEDDVAAYRETLGQVQRRIKEARSGGTAAK